MENSSEADNGSRYVTVAEAARLLGVSERTVYRRLRDGKLQRVGLSDRWRSSVRVGETNEIGEDVGVSENPVIMSDRKTEIELMTLQRALEEKNAQIARLTEQQGELMETVRRLQDQMYELARLTLQHSAARETEYRAAPAPVQESRKGRTGLIGRWFRPAGDNNRRG